MTAGPSTAALLSAMPHPVVLVDAADMVVAISSSASALFPLLSEGSPLAFGLRHPQMLGGIAELRARGGVQRLAFFQRLPVERSLDVQMTMLDNGYLLFTFTDLTQAMKLDRMRADFVANASHELRTPLASVLGFIETIRGPAKNDAVSRDKFLGIMEEQARRMARLIDDLLSLSSAELNAHVTPTATVDLVSVIRQAVDGLQPMAAKRGVALEVSTVAHDAPVLGDRDELLRVTDNLIDNAIKYGADGKRVMISLAPEGDRLWRVDVRDFGPGIAPEHLPRLTERFYRVDVAASRETGGTGLGLAIVKHALARHGARLEIDSKPGEGSVFRVLIGRAGATPNS
jgi:two-component system, OmpR family, phosphate regulon sensor histidine kinase PhoR